MRRFDSVGQFFFWLWQRFKPAWRKIFAVIVFNCKLDVVAFVVVLPTILMIFVLREQFFEILRDENLSPSQRYIATAKVIGKPFEGHPIVGLVFSLLCFSWPFAIPYLFWRFGWFKPDKR